MSLKQTIEELRAEINRCEAAYKQLHSAKCSNREMIEAELAWIQEETSRTVAEYSKLVSVAAEAA